MTPHDAATALLNPISKFGAKWMTAGPTYSGAALLGYEGIDFYFCGRGGVLGDATVEAVASTFAFFDHDTIAAAWERGKIVQPVMVAAEQFIGQCHEYGRHNFNGSSDLATLGDLLERVLTAASPAGLPLFAATRAMAAPSDPAGRAAHHLNVFREYRGAAHVAALATIGLTPLEAVVVSGGEGGARFLGHSGDIPPATDAQRIAWGLLEERTSDTMLPAFGTLSGDELDELVRLVGDGLTTSSPRPPTERLS